MALIVPDSYDKLFCRCDGTTTSFVDSSTANPKTITANGNATQLPIKFNRTAAFFNGTTDYVSVPDHSDFYLGTNDFTIDFWFTFNKLPVDGETAVRLFGQSTDSNNYFMASVGNSGGSYSVWIIIKESGNLFNRYGVISTPVIGEWHHLAFVRGSTSNWYIFYDGTALSLTSGGGSLGTSTAIGNYTGTFDIGDVPVSSKPFNGWMKEFRLSNSARWTSNFTPRTTQYSSDSNTKLLLHFDSPANSPLGPAIYFDGTGDYLSLADSADWDFGTGDFTIEAFINVPTLPGDGIYYTIASHFEDASNFWNFSLYSADGNYYLTFDSYVAGEPTVSFNKIMSPIYANKWDHYAITRSGTSFYVFKNGVQQSTTVTDADAIADVTGTLRIGMFNSNRYMLGFMRELRISNTARYTSAFTPSQTGFTVDSNTKLYIKGNEANGVTTFVDSETTPKTVTTNGDAKIKYTEDYRSCIFKDDGNTGHKPYPQGAAKVDFFAAFGGGVSYLDGTGDYLSIPADIDFDFGSEDFTVELWVRRNTSTEQHYLIAYENADATSLGWQFYVYYEAGADNGRIDFAVQTGATYKAILTGTGKAFANQWAHIALVRHGNIMRGFVNGILSGSVDVTGVSVNGSLNQVYVGRTAYSSPRYANARIDNVRVSKGIARYTAAFNPPEDNPNLASTQMLLFF